MTGTRAESRDRDENDRWVMVGTLAHSVLLVVPMLMEEKMIIVTPDNDHDSKALIFCIKSFPPYFPLDPIPLSRESSLHFVICIISPSLELFFVLVLFLSRPHKVGRSNTTDDLVDLCLRCTSMEPKLTHTRHGRTKCRVRMCDVHGVPRSGGSTADYWSGWWWWRWWYSILDRSANSTLHPHPH